MKKKRSDILGGIRKGLELIPTLNESSRTGVIGNLTHSIADELNQLWLETDASFERSNPLTARGNALDDWGNRLGIRRKTSSRAKSATSQVVFVNSGTFGSLSPNPIVIPNSTIITSHDGQYTVKVDDSIVTEAGIVLNPSSSRQSIPVISLGNDPGEVIPAGALNIIQLSTPGILTRNVSSITGEVTESDENYRYRIVRKIQGQNQNNISNLEFALLSIPGVSAIRINPLVMGGGSAQILVVGSSGIPSPQLLNLVQSIAENQTSTTLFRTVGVEPVMLKLTVLTNVLDSQLINTSFLEYIDSLEPGQEFNFAQFQLFSGIPMILNNAEYNGVKTTDQVLSIRPNQIFIADGSSGNPVLVVNQ